MPRVHVRFNRIRLVGTCIVLQACVMNCGDVKVLNIACTTRVTVQEHLSIYVDCSQASIHVTNTTGANLQP